MPSSAASSDAGVEEGAVVAPGSAAWWQERRALSERRRPRTAGLSTGRIIDAAVRLVDAEGLAALTVRRLADDLGTGSASLYRHVASREELIVLMVDHVIGEVVLPDERLAGRDRVERLALELRRVLLTHAELLPALAASPLLGPNARRGSEVGLVAMLDAGYAPAVAVSAVLALIDFVLGTVYFDTSSAGRSLDPGPHPTDPTITVPLGEEVFAFGLETFLVGLEQRYRSSLPRPR